MTWIAPLAEGDEARIRSLVAARGLVEGHDLRLSVERERKEQEEALDAQAERLLSARPDVIVVNAAVIGSLKKRTRDIPVVFYNLNIDPVKGELVESLQRPGTNFTGTTLGFDDFAPKIWELLKEISPSMKRAGLLVPAEGMREGLEAAAEARRTGKATWSEIHDRAADALGIEIVHIGISRDWSAKQIAAEIARAQVQGIWVGVGTPSMPQFLKASKLPAVSHSFGPVRRGTAHAGVEWNLREGEAYAALILSRILRGESPATIPVYRMNKWRVAYNLAAARSAGIEIPATLRLRADEVYE